MITKFIVLLRYKGIIWLKFRYYTKTLKYDKKIKIKI